MMAPRLLICRNGFRIMRLRPLNIAALLYQMADLVRGDRQFALGANVDGGHRQRVVASPRPFTRFGFTSLWYSHDPILRASCPPQPLCCSYDNQSSLTQNVRRLTRFCVGREKHTFSLRHPQVLTLNFSARFLYFHLVDRHHIP